MNQGALRESEKRASSALQPQGVSREMGQQETVEYRTPDGMSAAAFNSMFGIGCSVFWLPRKPRQAVMKYNLERRRN